MVISEAKVHCTLVETITKVYFSSLPSTLNTTILKMDPKIGKEREFGREGRRKSRGGRGDKTQTKYITVNFFIQCLNFPFLLNELDLAGIGFPILVIASINSHT